MPALTIMVFFIVATIHSVYFFSTDYLLGSLVPVLLIAFGWRYAADCRKMIPLFLSIYWGLNLILSLRKLWSGDIQHGITGNWNWSAILVLVSGAAFLHIIYEFCGKHYAGKLLMITVGILSAWQLTLYPSRGAILAVAAATLFFLLIYLYRLNNRIALGSAIVLLLAFLGTIRFYDLTAHDARTYLFPAAIKIMVSQPWFGVAPWRYEDFAFLNCASGYFLERFVAERSPHPHNQFLFIAASYGIPALAAWLYLIFRPIPAAMKKLFTAQSSFLFFIFLVLLFGGMVDVTLDTWPCKYFFPIIVGIYWHDFAPLESWQAHRGTVKFCQSLGIMFLMTSLYFATLSTLSSWHYREGCKSADSGNSPEALRQFGTSAKILPTPFALYRAGMIALYDAKQPEAALSWFSQIPKLTGMQNFLNYNNNMARIYCLKNEPEKALPYFKKEAELYPYGILNWYFYAQTLEYLGRHKEAAAARKSFETAMKAKKMLPKYLPLIMKNQLYDLKPHLFHEQRNQQEGQ